MQQQMMANFDAAANGSMKYGGAKFAPEQFLNN